MLHSQITIYIHWYLPRVTYDRDLFSIHRNKTHEHFKPPCSVDSKINRIYFVWYLWGNCTEWEGAFQKFTDVTGSTSNFSKCSFTKKTWYPIHLVRLETQIKFFPTSTLFFLLCLVFKDLDTELQETFDNNFFGNVGVIFYDNIVKC